MIDKKLFDLAEQTREILKDQQKKALESLKDLPEGEEKERLHKLLKKASAGELSVQDAQKELSKIMQDNAS